MLRALCNVLVMAGTIGICCRGFYGADSGHDGPPQPVDWGRKWRASVFMVASASIAVGAAVFMYVIDRKRPPDGNPGRDPTG